jgi:hypothetical protein
MFLSTDTLIYSYISTIFFLRNFFLHLSGLYALSGGPDSYAPSGAGLAYQNPTEQLHLHNVQEKNSQMLPRRRIAHHRRRRKGLPKMNGAGNTSQ